MIVIANNKVEILNPNYLHIRRYDLLPYIEGTCVLKDNSRPWEGSNSSIEMGVYDSVENIRYNTPFVWNHIKILSLDINNNIKPWDRAFVFNAEVEIYPKCGCVNDVFKHTFTVKNGIFFFVDSVLKTINDLLDKGYPVEDINFDFLDNQCICFNFRAANHQPKPKFELNKECMPEGYYSLIEDMKIVVHKNATSQCSWEEVDIILKTSDKYIINIVDQILKSSHTYFAPHTEGTETTFSFHTNPESRDYTYSHPKILANEETHKQFKKLYSKKLLVEGINLLDINNAVEFFATNK
jgi:hypothetical protein